MATIKNTIKLQDQMTPVLRTILKSLNSTIDVMAGVDKVSNKSFDKMKRDVRSAQQALDNFNNSADDVPRKANQGAAAFGRWKNPLVQASALIYTIKNALEGLSGGIKLADNFTTSYARIGLVNESINDGLRTTEELQNAILASANRSRSSYEATANAVGKLGLLASDSFKDTDEIIAFAEVMNKAFKVGGTSGEEAASAMYQLTQAMGAGKLQGDEFRSIMENAPMLADSIAKYMGKSKGELKELSREGLITSDIIKGALFEAASGIETQFEKLPKTWGEIGTEIKNSSIEMFQPVIERLSAIANSEMFAEFQSKLLTFIGQIADYALIAIDYIGKIGSWITEHKDTIIGAILSIMAMMLAFKAIALGTAIEVAFAWAVANWPLLLMIAIIGILVFAWTQFGDTGKIVIAVIGAIIAIVTLWIIAQKLLNGVLIANPIGLIIMAIGLLIAAIIAIVVWVIDLWQTNMDFKYGIIKIWNSILGFFDKIPLFFMKIGYGIADAFSYAKVTGLTLMEKLANGVIDIVNDVISVLNKIPGVEIEALGHLSFAASAAASEEAKRQSRDAKLADKESAVAAKAAARQQQADRDRALDTVNLAKKKAKAEADKKKQEEKKLDMSGKTTGFDYAGLVGGNGATKIAGGDLDSVGKINDDVSITNEDIKLLKDVAKTEFINKYTTLRPEMKVTFGDVHETADVTRIMEAIETMTEDALATSLLN